MAPPWVACEAAVGKALRPLDTRPLTPRPLTPRPLTPRPLAEASRAGKDSRAAEAATATSPGEPRSWSEAVARLASLRDLTHLSVEHLDCRRVLDARGVTHVLAHAVTHAVTQVVMHAVTHVSTTGSPEWITLAKYARRYARHVNVALLRMVEAGLICDSWIPELKIEMVRRVRTGVGRV